MDYAALVSIIETTSETTFETDVVNSFITQAETTIYQTVQFPALRKVVTAALTTADPFITVPTDFLYPLSFAVVDNDSSYNFLLNKDVNFIREAYPNPASTGLPAHYSLYSATEVLIGPTPDDNYTYVMQYGHYPESIITAGTTWLGDTFDVALANGALIQACRYMRMEPDTIAQYERLYVQAIGLLKNFGEGKLRSDVYRSGQPRQPVS